ncbi:hypothetical protein D3C77_37970 [compost metagenome]
MVKEVHTYAQREELRYKANPTCKWCKGRGWLCIQEAGALYKDIECSCTKPKVE